VKKRYAFALNNKENIILKSSMAWNKVAILEDIQILFQTRKVELVIGHGIAVGMLQDVINGLQGATQNKRVLSDQCVCKGNLGLYAVQDFAACILEQNHDNNVFQECSHQSYRICAAKKRAVWVYNNKFGSIMLEITPWFEVTESTEQKKYEQWIQQYRPIAKRIITIEKAHELVEQIRSLLRIIRINGDLSPDFE
jgi:hypothetical protein